MEASPTQAAMEESAAQVPVEVACGDELLDFASSRPRQMKWLPKGYV